jgi:hypothetical protein
MVVVLLCSFIQLGYTFRILGPNMNFPFNHILRRRVLFHLTVHKRQQLFRHYLKVFQIHTQIFSEYFTPAAVLDPCKIWVALLVFQHHVQTTMQHCFKARFRDSEQFSMLLNPFLPKSFNSCLHITFNPSRLCLAYILRRLYQL